jgi:hypothetical protein
MVNRYRRFKELKENAKMCLAGRGNDVEQLTNAVHEIHWMRKDEVPDYSWKNVQSIIDKCTTHQQVAEEGVINASINNMNFDERNALRKTIEIL